MDVGINESLDVDRYFGDAASATLFHHETSPLRVPGFDAASPFGAGSTQTWLLAQISPALEHNRRRFVHAIAQHDSRVLIDGGWMLSLGQ